MSLLSMEIELPAVQKDGYGGVEPGIFLEIWKQLQAQGWDHDGFGVSRLCDHVPGGCIKPKQMFSTDTGPTIEISPHPAPTIQEVEQQVTDLRDLIVTELDKRGVAILGSGVHPLLGCSEAEYYRYRTPRGPYDYAINVRGWAHRTMLNIAATQEVIDVPFEESITALRVMHRLAGIMFFLCRNDPDYTKSDGYRLSIRPKAWQSHVPSYGPFAADSHKVGLPATEVHNWRDYLKLLWDISPMFMLGTKNYGLVYVPEHPSFLQFLTTPPSTGWEARTVGEERPVRVHPDMSHVAQTDWTFMGFARLRWKWRDNSTTVTELVQAIEEQRVDNFLHEHLGKVLIENRSSATAPPGAEMASLALVTGLMSNLKQVATFVDQFPYAFWLAVAHAAEYKPLNTEVAGVSTTRLARTIVDMAKEGLTIRGNGEERYLEPFYDRIERGQSPAEEMLMVYERQGINGVVAALRYNP